MNEPAYVYPVLGCPALRYRALHRDGQWVCVLCIRRADGWRQLLHLQTACADEASACALAARLAGRGKEADMATLREQYEGVWGALGRALVKAAERKKGAA